MTTNKTILLLLAGFLAACAPAQNDEAAVASIVEPADGARFDLGVQVNITTDLQHPRGAQSASLFANGELVRVDDLNAPIYSGQMIQGWLPENPGSYELQVLFTSARGDELLSDKISVAVGAEFAEAAVVELSLITPTPEPSPTDTAQPVAPMVTGNVDSNCRRGPSTAYQNIATLLEGQSAPIIGRLADNTWWVIDLVDASENCWVWDDLVTVSGDPSGVPVITAPALPLAVPVQVAPLLDVSCSSLIDVNFAWEPVTGEVNGYVYQIQSSNDPNGSYSDYASGGTSGTQVTEELICGSTTYYRWRVRAEAPGGQEGPWSDWIVFKAGF